MIRPLTLCIFILTSLCPSAGFSDRHPTEVVIVGTQHFISDMPEGYTPAHLRALLEKIKPDVLAVEAPTNAPDPWSMAPLELSWITRPWATQRALPVEPCAWLVDDYNQQIGKMFQQINPARAQENETRLARAAAGASIEAMNSPATLDAWRTYHATLHSLYGQDTPWEQWNARIVQNIRTVCDKHPGKRVAIVFGAAHAYYLSDALQNDKQIRVLPVNGFLPLTKQETTAALLPTDYVKSLRLLNFESLTPQALDQLEKQLQKVQQYPDLQNDYLLFHGKLLSHRGQFPQALTEFRTLSQADPAAISTFDATSNLRESGLIFAALTLRKMNHPAEAQHELQEILKLKTLAPSTRQWVEQLLQTP